ncbi:MAG TPA: NAD-dependent epimerase/dehydratase family protein, partial [Mycolicibacterium fallax]|nr:NAD-dependent epimerase/dehydratase family protein [Mycolicibacterium fallax]HSA42033.1 NAD-dependent epimerase/dehydratase family protein [Mycobacterium sp.]
MTWLVTGGAGYIGAHVVRALRADGIAVVVIDDLSTGLPQFVPDDVPLVRANLLDGDAVRATLAEHDVVGVIHIAGYKYAGESVTRPLHTYTQNVSAMVTLLAAMADAGVDKCVFSSSAATYGTPDTELVDESTPTRPESPYGESKLIGEWLLRDVAAAGAFQHTSLR